MLNETKKQIIANTVTEAVHRSLEKMEISELIEENLIEAREWIKKVCKVSVDKGYYEIDPEDDNTLRYTIYTLGRAFRVKCESFENAAVIKEVVPRLVKEVLKSFKKYVEVNQEEGYTFAGKHQIDYKVFTDPYTYDTMATFCIRIRKIPDKTSDKCPVGDVRWNEDFLNLRKGEAEELTEKDVETLDKS